MEVCVGKEMTILNKQLCNPLMYIVLCHNLKTAKNYVNNCTIKDNQRYIIVNYIEVYNKFYNYLYIYLLIEAYLNYKNNSNNKELFIKRLYILH